MAQLYANNAESTLTAGISAGATSLSIADASRFPAVSGSDWHWATLTAAGDTESAWEIVKVTARTGTTLTITRAQQGTTALAWNAGDKVELRATAADYGPPTFIAPRSASAASSGTPTPNADTTDQFALTAQAATAAFANPTGTPADGQLLRVRIKDNGTSRSITWDTAYRACGASLPAWTVPSKTLYVGFIYNSADAKWDCVSAAQEA